jgi:hypothetical protein
VGGSASEPKCLPQLLSQTLATCSGGAERASSALPRLRPKGTVGSAGRTVHSGEGAAVADPPNANAQPPASSITAATSPSGPGIDGSCLWI